MKTTQGIDVDLFVTGGLVAVIIYFILLLFLILQFSPFFFFLNQQPFNCTEFWRSDTDDDYLYPPSGVALR